MNSAPDRRLYDEQGRPTALLNRYLAAREEMRRAERDYADALARAQKDSRALQQWPMTGAGHRRVVERAQARLAALDPRHEIEAALQALDDEQD